jgi:hypothetical protein
MGLMRGVVVPSTHDDAIEAGIQARSAAYEAQLDLVEQFAKCAKCGGDRFTERPVTKRNPADPPHV